MPPDEEQRRRRSDDPEALLTASPIVAAVSADIGADLKRTLRWLVRATVLLYIFMIGLTGYTWMKTNDNNDALCALRKDAQGRYDTSTKFLHDHPQGFPGVATREEIQRGVDTSAATLDALSDLNC